MSVHDWITLALVVFGTLFQVALAIDRWVHRQSYDGVRVGEKLVDLRQMMLDANARASEKWSEIQTRHLNLELEVSRLKARDELRSEAPRSPHD